MVEVTVDAGICGFCSTIKCESDDMQEVTVDFTTDCPSLKPLEEELGTIDGYGVCFAKYGDGEIVQLGHKYCKHPGCPVPAGIIKAIEVACGLALPKDSEIRVQKK